MASPKPAQSRIEIVEGLRGLAALAVAWFHFTNANAAFPTAGWLRASGTYGWLGVESFFVISGFIIPYAMLRAGYRLAAWPTFLAKRLLRLEPSYLVSILVTLALWWISWTSAPSPNFTRQPPTATQVLLHVGYLPALFGYAWLDTAYWTLAIEFQYYLLMAVSFCWLVHPSARIRFSCFAVACLLPFAVSSDSLVFRYLGLFALGTATFWRHSGSLTGGGYLIVLAAATGVTSATLGPAVAAVGTGTALLIGYGNRLRWRPVALMARTGALSYSLYLLHGSVGERVVNLGARYAHAPMAQMTVMVAAVAVSTGAAYALYRLVELPCLGASASLRYGRRSRAQAPSVMARKTGANCVS